MSKALAAEYQAQQWVMEPMALKAFAERIASIPESSQLLSIKVAETKSQLNVVGSTARIPIDGYLLNKVPDWMKLFGIKATSYEQIAADINEAISRKDITAIELIVDSPGGMVAGVIGAADAIYSARQKKPVTAIVNNLSASGAYWLSSQAEKIIASDINTGIGSIGVFTWYVDWTDYENKLGIKVIVIRSGEHKGMGLDAITENQIAAVQQYIDDTANNFIDAVARGRMFDTEKVAELATGKLWIAARAKGLGLVDKVMKLTVNKKNNSNSKGKVMEEMTQEQIDAQNAANEKKTAEQIQKAKSEGSNDALAKERKRIAEINDKFGDDLQFANQAITEGWTMEKANAEYVDVLRGKLNEKDKAAQENDKAKGAEALASGDTDTGSEGDFMQQAKAMAAEKKISVTAAMKQLRRTKPELHQAHLQKCGESGRAMYNQAI